MLISTVFSNTLSSSFVQLEQLDFGGIMDMGGIKLH